MMLFFSIYGGVLAAALLIVAADVFFGLPTLDNLTQPGFDVSPTTAMRVTVIVPARNEAEDIEDCLRSLAGQDYDNLEVIAVDDRSTDTTGAIMDRVAAEFPERIRIVHVTSLPSGWLGKTHAMWTAGELATGDWLLFTDGDVKFRCDAIRRSLAYAERMQSDHLVVWPTLELKSPGENMIASNLRLGALVSRPWRIPDPRTWAAIGVGAFNMVRRAVYRQIGTFKALRLSVVDDLDLGRMMKRATGRSRVAIAPGMVTLHWAAGAMGLVNSTAKNAYAAIGFRWYVAIPGAIVNLFVHAAPFALVFLAPGWTKMYFAIALACNFYFYVALRRVVDIPLRYFFLHPIGAALVSYAVLNSMWQTIRAGGVVWRGTTYSYDVLRGDPSAPLAETQNGDTIS